jgi:hypothetical protein
MVLDGLPPEGCGDVGLACTRSSHQHYVVGVLQEFTAVQLAYQRLFQLAVTEVKDSKVPVRRDLVTFNW